MLEISLGEMKIMGLFNMVTSLNSSMLKCSSMSVIVLAASKNSMNLMYAVLMKEFSDARYLKGVLFEN